MFVFIWQIIMKLFFAYFFILIFFDKCDTILICKAGMLCNMTKSLNKKFFMSNMKHKEYYS